MEIAFSEKISPQLSAALLAHLDRRDLAVECREVV